MTINDLHMTEEQIVNEIQFMRMWDKYLQKMLGEEKHSELSLGFARMLTSAELKSFGASDEEIEKACNFADMMAIADEHKADTPQTEQTEPTTEDSSMVVTVKPYKPTNKEILDALEKSDCPWK